jgi:uncharacterized protein (DUF1330 family)
MITVCIRYKIDMHKMAEFEQYARRWRDIVPRCGGTLVAYYLPTKIAGPTDVAMGLFEFDSLAQYETYRDALMQDAAAKENLDFASQTRCLLAEDRSILRKV